MIDDKGLPARNVSELIEELATSRGRATLHLKSGRDIRGVVAQLVRGRSEETVIIVADDGATYVASATIEAVTVHGLRPTPRDPPPTRLAARRALDEHRRRISAVLGVEVTLQAPIEETEAGEDLRALVELSADAASAIDSAARDEMGKVAIAGHVRTIVLVNEPTATVRLEGDALAFAAPFAAEHGAPGRLSSADLRAAIEALF